MPPAGLVSGESSPSPERPRLRPRAAKEGAPVRGRPRRLRPSPPHEASKGLKPVRVDHSGRHDQEFEDMRFPVPAGPPDHDLRLVAEPLQRPGGGGRP